MSTAENQGPQEAGTNEAENKAPLTRDQIRSKLLGQRHKPKTVSITLFGVDMELRQPSLRSILQARSQEPDQAAIDMIIRYCYVPGSDDPIFETSDRDTIANWPFGEDLLRLQNAITSLTGVDISEETKEISEDPLSE